MSFKYLGGVLSLILLCLSACVKEDTPIILPPKTGSQIMQVFMGPKPYDTTVFVSLDDKKIVRKALSYNWDLRFDASDNGLAILMNTGKNMRAFNTGKKAMHIVTDTVGQPEVWAYDIPNRLIDSAYLNEWHVNGISKMDVYILRMDDDNFTGEKYYKIQVLSADETGYYIKWDTLNSINAKTIFIPKNRNKNFVYCSFDNGGNVPEIEPNKTEWDMCFTRYCVPFYGFSPLIYYPVNGVMTNSYNTLSSADTAKLQDFKTFTSEQANQMQLNDYVNTIGYNWKSPTGPNFSFVTQDKYVYTIKTQKGYLYKLHFLDFYYQGIGGAPKFEYERLK